MKKCASCSKDLPEAALHCVFCGAKQAPAPAVPASAVAKTAFGYSANEVMAQLGQQGQQPPGYQPPAPAYQPPPARANPPSQPTPLQQPPPMSPAAANAKTLFVQGPGPQPPAPQAYSPPAPQQFNAPAGQAYNPTVQAYPPAPQQQQYGYQQPQPAAYPPPASGGMGIHSPQQATPAPLPAVQTPYLDSKTGVGRRGPRPIDPWKDSLKLMMFIWGAVALAAFATPVMTDPMAFNWDAILHAEGSAKIPPLVWASVGLLSIVFAAIPMVSLPRGTLAAVLGLAGIFVPLAVTAFPPWQFFVPMLGSLALVVGLLVRNEYTESLLARMLVTIGAICWLAPWLIPDHGQIPLVEVIKILLNGANHMEIVVVALGQIVLAVLCLLVWMPGPATAGAKIFAWIVILFPVVVFALGLLGASHIGDVVSKQPAKLVAWAPGVAYTVLVGYGLATVIGKQLE